MLSTLCLLIFVFVSSGDATVLKIIRDTVGGGGLDFAINGGGWGSGIAGSTAGRGEIGGELAFGYTAGAIKPFLPHIHSDQTRYLEKVINQHQGQGGYPQQGQGYLLQGQGSYSQHGQGGYPIQQSNPQPGIGYPLYGVGGFPVQEGKPIGIIPQGGNVGGLAPQSGFPQQVGYSPYRGQGIYIPQSPQAGYPSHGGYVPQSPQAGHPSQGYIPQSTQAGHPNQGYIPQSPQAGYPSQGGHIPQSPQAGYPPNHGSHIPHVPHATRPYPGQGFGGNIQPGEFGHPDESAIIDPRKGGNRGPEKPISQGRRRTTSSTSEPAEDSLTTESPAETDDSLDENIIPEDKEEK